MDNSSHLEGLVERLEKERVAFNSSEWFARVSPDLLKEAAALLRSQAVEIEGLKEEKDAAYADRARDTVTASERIFKLVQDLRSAEARADRAEKDNAELRYADQYHLAVERRLTASLSRLQADLKLKEEALRPFAAITPSSLYLEDGSAAERYCVRLFDSSRHEPPHDFTGADLARARVALTPETPDGK